MSKIRIRVMKHRDRRAKEERKRTELEELRNDTRKMTVVVQDWTESEAGWGQRPDGFSLHLNKTQMEAYNAEYWAKEKAGSGGVTPHEYSFPDGHDIADVPMIVYDAIKKSKNGIRAWSSFDYERQFGIKKDF